jgi:hypothetical protein
MNDASMAVMIINAQIVREDVAAVAGLENKIKAAMKAIIHKNWMDTNDNSMMRAALAAVLLDVGQDSEDGKLLLRTMDGLRKLSAIIAAAQAGLSVNLEESDVPKEDDKLLPLISWWHEAKAA